MTTNKGPLAGIRVLDVSDITSPRVIGAYDYHPPFPEPTHTVMPLRLPVGKKRIAVAVVGSQPNNHFVANSHGAATEEREAWRAVSSANGVTAAVA